jgi:ubiquinone/menaquinone biosynthesis C-methylase UbiE
MSSDASSRPGLYRGSAPYYDAFRLPYPPVLLDDLCERASVSGTGRLLDLACGPGTVALPLSDRFLEAWAIDQEPEAIAFAARKAERVGVHNVRWIVGRAEDVDLSTETFELVTIGTAFHWLDRARVATLAFRRLVPGGHLALLWGPNPLIGTAPWQEVLNATVLEWMHDLGATDRAQTYLAGHPPESSHAVVMATAGFEVVGRHEFEAVHEWTVESLTGFVYSTSLLPPAVLGSCMAAFAVDLGDRLRGMEPSGRFELTATFAYDLARRPLG